MSEPHKLTEWNDTSDLHYFDCDLFQTYGYGARRGDCDCDARKDVEAAIAAGAA